MSLRRHRNSTWLVVACLLLSSPAFAMLQVGQPAPGFTRTDLQGQSHSLSDYLGKTVLLAFIGYD